MSAAREATRYEEIMAAGSVRPGDLAARFARASRVARAAIETASDHETAIRDVAAGVAAPALVLSSSGSRSKPGGAGCGGSGSCPATARSYTS